MTQYISESPTEPVPTKIEPAALSQYFNSKFGCPQDVRVEKTPVPII